jgi:protein XagA
MTAKLSRILLSISTLILTQNIYAGGGWPQPKGKGYFKLGHYSIISDAYYSPNGKIIDIATAGIHISSLYGEYGFTDRLTGIAYLPFFSRATLNEQKSGRTGNILAEGDKLNSFGDTDIGIKYGLIVNKPIVVSAGLTLGLPLGKQSGGSTGVLQTGDGEFNQMISVEASRGLNKGKSWISVLLAFNNRTQNFSDELRFGLELGTKIGTKWFANVKIINVNSLNNGSDLETPSNGIFSNNIEYLAITPELSYQWNEKYGVTGAVGFAAAGKRVLASPSFSLGVFLKL